MKLKFNFIVNRMTKLEQLLALQMRTAYHKFFANIAKSEVTEIHVNCDFY